jgi:23S rRNA-/tRNA-specific pseudouridylate synthase
MNIQFSVLISKESSLGRFLQESFGLSRQKIKQYLPKKKREQIINDRDLVSIPINLMNFLIIHPTCSIDHIETLFEDDIFLVLDKPIGIHSVPRDYLGQDNILTYVREKFGSRYLKINERDYNRGLLNRLDLETSGPIILVKERSVYDELIKSQNRGLQSKRYLAIVEQWENEDSVILEDWLKPYGPKQALVRAGRKGEGSRCRIKVHKFAVNKKGQTLLVIELFEGKRHQIRVQLQNVNASILGDPLYGVAGSANRMYLHAWYYQVDFGSNTWVFKSGPPLAFRELFPDLLNLDRFLK